MSRRKLVEIMMIVPSARKNLPIVKGTFSYRFVGSEGLPHSVDNHFFRSEEEYETEVRAAFAALTEAGGGRMLFSHSVSSGSWGMRA